MERKKNGPDENGAVVKVVFRKELSSTWCADAYGLVLLCNDASASATRMSEPMGTLSEFA